LSALRIALEQVPPLKSMVQALENTRETSPADSLSERVFGEPRADAMSPVPLLTELAANWWRCRIW